MPKNIIICCDGTGNEIKENQSNVLKFFRVLKKSDTQIAYYDPGVGTIGNSDPWSRFKHKAKGVFGLVTGYGLDENVLDAYKFLIRNYQPDDKIYLLGFSRGAYTVRVLAGFINMTGLLAPEQENLSQYALTAYKQASEKDDFQIAWRFQEVTAARRVTIRFMGCWDTVGSVIVPRPDRFYLPSLEELPFTRKNSCVQVFRQALAIDERRRMFRITRWEEPQLFKFNPFVKDADASPQDIKQRWFSGVHSDIGGGYPEAQSGAAKLPLRWMVEQAREHDVVFRERMVDRLVCGNNPKNSSRNYVTPDANADLHDSMNFAWRILEWLPKRAKRKEWPARRSFAGFYLPRSEPRIIEQNATIDASVRDRAQYTSGGEPYFPENLPSQVAENKP